MNQRFLHFLLLFVLLTNILLVSYCRLPSDMQTKETNAENILQVSYVFTFDGPFSIGSLNSDDETIIASDLDLDGDMDIITGIANGSIVIWRNDRSPSTNWKRNIIGCGGIEILRLAVGDLDGNGYPDFLSGDYFGNLYLWKNNGTVWINNWNQSGYNRAFYQGLFIGDIRGLYIADLDVDGDLDIITSGFNNNISVWENDGTPWDEDWVEYRIGRDVGRYEMAIGDLDGDNDLDFVASNGNSDDIYVLQNTGKPWSLFPKNKVGDAGDSAPSDSVLCFKIADLDGDSDNDIVTGDIDRNITIWFNDGTPFTGTWSNIWVGDASAWIYNLQINDMDLDNSLDIISLDTDKKISIWTNKTGAWIPEIIGTMEGITKALCVVDLDGESDLDIISVLAAIKSWKNVLPALFDGQVSPSVGGQNTVFNFTVHYESNENEPIQVSVTIDGFVYPMAKVNSHDYNYRDGVLFQLCFNSLTPNQIHTFRFYAESSTGFVALGETQIHYSPIVYPADQNPYDYDGDGLLDSVDPDDDNDGINDELDYYPHDPTRYSQSAIPLSFNEILLITLIATGILAIAIIIHGFSRIKTKKDDKKAISSPIAEKAPTKL